MSDVMRRATLSDRQARGGVIGGKGYGFQAAYIVSRIPDWIADPGFAAFLQEGAGDVDVLFQRADGEERWYIQVKDHPVAPAEARQVLAAFRSTTDGSPGTYTHFTLACPGLNEDLRRLRSAVEELRGAAPFYQPGHHEILDNTWEDLEGVVASLDLPVDARFLVDKVHFDTNLAGLTGDAGLRRQFVGGLLERGEWRGITSEAALRAYEKLALLCHQPEGLRQTYSREDLEAKIRKAVGEVPAAPDDLFDVPFMRNPDFVGREDDLERLHAALQGARDSVGIRPAGVTGQGGIGKTGLAVEYVYRHRGDYPGGVFWVNAAERLVDGLAGVGRRVRPGTVGLSNVEQVQAAADYLNLHGDALLVLDNLAEPAALNRPVPGGVVVGALPCRVLFTTRRRDLGRFRAVEVRVLPEGPALALLLRAECRRAVLGEEHPQHEEAREICAMLGYLPLALEIAGAFLSEWPRVALGDFRARLRAEGCLGTLDEEARELREASLPAIHGAAVAATLGTQWEALHDERARLLLRVAGQMPEAAAMPAARLGLLAGVEDKGGPGRPSALERGLKRLHDACLVEELRGGMVRLHPLVREFAAGRTPAGEVVGFRIECTGRLADAWEDFERLEDACAGRGVDALQEDLLAALGLAEVGGHVEARATNALGEGVTVRLRALLRVLQREAHNVLGWEREMQPALFAQQVQYRAVDLGKTELAERAAVRLEDLRVGWIGLRWRAASESPALERVLGEHDWTVTIVAVTPDGRRAVSGASESHLIVWDLDTGRELHTLTGHEGRVLDVAVTSDSRRAVSASADGVLIVWDLETGRALHTLGGHTDEVNEVVVTPDGRRAVSASDDKNLIVWDLETGRALHTLGGHTDKVNEVVVTPDGRRAVSGSEDKSLIVWDLDTGRAVHTLAGHEGMVYAVAVTPDGRRAVSVSKDNTLVVWDLDTGRALHTLIGHEDHVNAVALTPDGRRAVSASDEKRLIVWDLTTGRAVHTLVGHQIQVNAVTVTADGRRAVSASSDHALIVWDLNTGRALHRLAGHRDAVTAVAVTPDGRRAVSGSWDHRLIVWDISPSLNAGLDAGQAVHRLAGHEDHVNAVVVTPDGRRAVSASGDNTLIVWDLDTGRAVHTLAKHSWWVYDVAVTPDGRRAVSASDDKGLIVWNLDTGRVLHTLVGHGSFVNAVVATPDGRRAVSASNDKNLIVWDLETGRARHTLGGHTDEVNEVVVTPDGRRAVSASDDKNLIVWDLETGRALHTLGGHTDKVNEVVVTPDGRRAVSGSEDKSLIVWDLDTGRAVHTLAGHEGMVYAVAVTPDGRRAVSASWDRTLIVWDLITGRAVHTLMGHKLPVLAVALTPDGRRAVSASSDRRLIVWDIEDGRALGSVALEGPIECLAVAPDGVTLVAGDWAGNVYCFELHEAGAAPE